jgi:hypothetical protein
VTVKKRPMTADGTDVERRKTRRFPVVVPIEVSWRGTDGIAVKEDAVARQVNANGGFLKMSNYPVLGSRVTLANFLSAQTAEARVLAAPDSRQGVANGIIVELIVPSESFWGVDLQVNKAIVELQNLEKALQCEERGAPKNRSAIRCCSRQCSAFPPTSSNWRWSMRLPSAHCRTFNTTSSRRPF